MPQYFTFSTWQTATCYEWLSAHAADDIERMKREARDEAGSDPSKIVEVLSWKIQGFIEARSPFEVAAAGFFAELLERAICEIDYPNVAWAVYLGVEELSLDDLPPENL